MQTADIRLIRYSLAIVWLVTGVLSIGIYPQQDSFALLARIGIVGQSALAALYLGSAADITFGIMTLLIPSKALWQGQAVLVLIYTVVISIWLPEFWLHPFGPILKNIPFLTLLWLLYKYEGTTQ
ncbi:NAD-dependent epimerase/dehydratase [Methyloglobulus morosus KoM1]|uniref:NAD-dependent epimerase/dehydratase n=1 Tax=Methyloglobulus morosus KoM1 TaxID=1116472 RepID=V5BTP5_9GAMM|nr:DoxX-like family protein [Methyloglobulus morosus]ESS69552.1 NAD-dependent epimerase/dehydratase [Methyloglobulus morosus KoM1]